MDVQDFIKHVADGNAADAKNVLNDLLSAKAFEALDAKKMQIAKTAFNGQEIEVQDTEDTEQQ